MYKRYVKALRFKNIIKNVIVMNLSKYLIIIYKVLFKL